MSSPTNRVGSDIRIREVWADNLEMEFALIREIVDKYPYVAMDVEFPVVIIQRFGIFDSPADYRYQTLQTKVELLQPTRITLTFLDAAGDLSCFPSVRGCRCVWRFNFREFDVDGDGRGDGDDSRDCRRVPFVAMDTEFPGVAITPVRVFKNNADRNFHKLRTNDDLLHLIQVGFSFSDASGCLPPSPSGGGRGCIWQFNLWEFDVDRDFCNPDSIDLLRRSGIDFEKNREWGVDALRFAELLMSSGVVLNDSVQWIAFHGAYDFAYLLKILTCRRLPETSKGFFELVRTFFPTVYDIKHPMKFCNNLYVGLDNVAEQLDAERIGLSHQVGSDSLLTVRVFWKLKENYFHGSIERYAGSLYGRET